LEIKEFLGKVMSVILWGKKGILKIVIRKELGYRSDLKML